MNSKMVKAEKFGHLHLVYHFTVHLREKFQRKAKIYKAKSYFSDFYLYTNKY